MPKKILHLITGLDPGGAEAMLLKTLPNLQQTATHYVCCIAGRGVIGQQLERAGVSVTYLDLQYSFDATAANKLWRLLRTLKPDVLMTYLPHADLIGRVMGRVAGVPRIVTSVRVKLWTSPRYLPWFVGDALTSFMVDHYHFNSPAIAKTYQRWLGLSPQRVTIIPNGVPVATPQRAGDVVALRQQLNIAPDHTILCCVARLRQQKGHVYLLRALASVLRAWPKVTLLLVGDGPYKREVERHVKDYGLEQRVLLLGTRSDVSALLHLADIFVLPTLFEGMSNALLEAMAAGKPIITTDLAENRDLITSGVTGLLVPPRNSAALAQALQKLLAQPKLAARLGEAALQMSHEYELPAILRQYEHFFARV